MKRLISVMIEVDDDNYPISRNYGGTVADYLESDLVATAFAEQPGIRIQEVKQIFPAEMK